MRTQTRTEEDRVTHRQKKAAVYEPGKEASGDTSPVDAWISRQGGNPFLSRTPPGLWYLVIAALAKSYKHLRCSHLPLTNPNPESFFRFKGLLSFLAERM